MKRFYDSVDIEEDEKGFAILLDGKAIKTPLKRALVLPGMALASAVQKEWADQEDLIKPNEMPMTRLANTALDRIADGKAAVVQQLLRYCETDLLSFRADAPATLIKLQSDHWDPLLAWLECELAVCIAVAKGLTPITVTEKDCHRLLKEIQDLSVFALSGLGAIVNASGSLVIGLAVLREHIDGDAAFLAATVDERFQLERWGADEEAVAVLDGRKKDICSAASFLNLL